MDRQRFITLVAQEQESLRRFLCSLCGDPSLADDLAQDALVKAYVASETFTERKATFSTWLMKIAYNCFVDRIRRSRALPGQTSPQEAAAVSDPGSAADASFAHEDLYRALRLLPPTEQTALLLFYMEDRPLKEVAAILSLPEGTVKSHLSRGRSHLRTFLTKKI